MILDHFPETAGIGIGGYAFKNDLRGTHGQRAVGDVAVAGNPADVGRAPENVARFVIERPLHREYGPQQIAAGDIYPALEKGAIDAAEWIGPYDDEKLGFVKVAKYYYTPGWWEPNSMGHVIVNLKAWESLPKEYHAAFAPACGETNAIAMAKYDAVNPGGMRKLVSQGAQLRAFPKPVLAVEQ